MKRPVRRVAAAYVVLTLLAAGAAAGQRALRSQPARSDRATGEAKRFLDLTSGSPGAPTRAMTAAPAAAGASEGPAAPVDGDRMPNGWKLTPAGKQVETQRFPLGLTATADQSQIIVTSDSGGMQSLHVVDAKTLMATMTPATNLFMGVAATPGGQVFASGGNADRLFRFRLAGPTLVHEDVTEAALFPNHSPVDAVVGRASGQSPPPNLPVGDGLRVPGYPGNSVLDGALLYVAGTLSEPAGTPSVCPSAQAACARVTVVDTAAANGMGAVVARVPVGLDAYGLALDPVRKLLYVSNWADEAGRGGPSGGTVSVVDVSDPAKAREVAWTRVGHHPSAVQLSRDKTRLFVANSNDDSISVLDVSATQPTVVTTESVKPAGALPVGAHPDAFALSPGGDRLFVALAGLNAVEVRDGRTGARLANEPKYIPTGWYPSALLVTGTADNYRLWVTNAKGIGPAPGINLSVGWLGNPPLGPRTNGTVSAIDLPVTNGELNTWTRQVVDNDRLRNGRLNPCAPSPAVRPSEVLCPKRGKKSPVKHVLYIVTENKTFDQYFGDVNAARYDADPKWLLYGQPFTPNHHAMVDRYSLSDRFFSDAEVSVTGHSFTSGAVATDHNEKTWQADYDQGLRGTHGGGDPLRPSIGSPAANDLIRQGDDELQDPEGGYIFEAFKRAGAKPPTTPGAQLTMGIYGEGTARESGDMSAYQAKGKNKDGSTAYWKQGDIQYFDTCRANMFITGTAGDSPWADSPDQVQDCAGRTLDPQFTLQHWNDVYKRSGGKTDVMPNFMYMSLPVNHTLGTNLGSPTPPSMVADNDYAIGLIIEALSKSPFWESTVVMMTEDDTQAAGDHVSPLRDYLQVVGPWAKPGANHQWGSMGSLLRTIETLFGVPPITLNDRLSVPQHGAFRRSLSEQPDRSPYTAVRPVVPFAVNQLGAPGQQASMAMNWSTYDKIDEATLNAILYALARGTPIQLPEYAR
jgi:DNA-binding beta-propeller fold protein YncE